MVLASSGCRGPSRSAPQTYAERTFRGRQLRFAGRLWRARGMSTVAPSGAGPNYWSDAPEQLWVDEAGRLHLRLAQHRGRWRAVELFTPLRRPYFEVSFELDSPVARLDPNVVVGLFVYRSDQSEVDVEFARWGDAAAPNAQFALAPVTSPGHRRRFRWRPGGGRSRHSIRWTSAGLELESKGQGGAQFRHRWAGKGLLSERPHGVHINLWLAGGEAPRDGRPVELIVRDVTITPAP